VIRQLGCGSKARDGSGMVRGSTFMRQGGVGCMARHEDMAAMDFHGGGVHFSYDGGKGRHRQVGPTSQRGKKAGIGCQQGRAREALYADRPGGELGLGVEQACAAWLQGRIEGEGERVFLFYFVFKTKFNYEPNANSNRVSNILFNSNKSEQVLVSFPKINFTTF